MPAVSVKQLFDEALEIESPAARSAFLEQACAGAPGVRRRVEALLTAYAEAGSFMEAPAPGPETAAYFAQTSGAALAGEAPGSLLGPYKLLQKIGEGGMGVVWMAEQETPVRRLVALKVIKAGMDSAQALARFEAERQALALMDHPNIAKVFDAGTTPSGRPFLVMELVKGVPITRWCDEQRLPPRARLELFAEVCRAVQHAHQKGVIHRDLKPSNVLVAPYDGRPVVKVIDFGVAKATGPRLTDKTMFTEFGTVLGTLEYMSPEQAELNNNDIDTRSDIYSLGVLLYELLTGSTPLTHERLKQSAFTELLRLIREEEPPRPSVRLSSCKETSATLSAQRRMEPAQLAAFLRGDLDWIVMKALEKERGRRYATASSLAQDIERCLADEPVEARPPSRTYLLRKLLRRHRALAAAGLIAFLALTAGVVGLTWGLLRAEQAKADEAKRAEGERAAKEKEIAARRLAEAAERDAKESEADTQAFSKFLVDDVLAAARPAGEQGGLGIGVTVKQALEAAEKRMPERFAGRPRAEAIARHDVGVTYWLLGETAKAIAQLERAVALRKQALGPQHRDTLESMHSLSVACTAAGQTKRALELAEETLRINLAKHGLRDRDTLSAQANLAILLGERGQAARGLALMEQALQISLEISGADHQQTLILQHQLGSMRAREGQFELAEPLLEQALSGHKAMFGPDHSITQATLGNLAALHRRRGRLDKAIPLFEEGLAAHRRQQGPDHPETLLAAFNLAVNYSEGKRAPEAAALVDEFLPRALRLKAGEQMREFGVDVAISVYGAAGLPARAEPLLRERLAAARGKAPEPSLAMLLSQLGANLLQQEKGAEAEPLLRESLEIRRRVDPDSWTTAWAESQLGAALAMQGKHADAEPVLRAGYDGMKRRAATIPVGNRPLIAEAGHRLRRCKEAQGKADEAETLRRQLAQPTSAGSSPATSPPLFERND